MRKKILSEILDDFKKIHGEKFDYSFTEYKGINENIKIKCIKHNIIFEQTPKNHLTTKYSCPECKKIASFIPEDEFFEKCKGVHNNKYEYLSRYKSNRENIYIKCIKCDNVFHQSAGAHLSGQGCPKCRNKRLNKSGKKKGGKISQEDFEKRSVQIYGDKYLYGEYKGCHSKMEFTCKKHNRIFLQTGDGHLVGKEGCSECRFENSTISHEKFIENCMKVHGDTFEYLSKYRTNKDYIKLKCKICDHEFERIALAHSQGQQCPNCYKLETRYTTEEFIEICNKVHNYRYDYSEVEYKSFNTKVRIKCEKHGYFYQGTYHHMSGRGCQKCAIVKSRVTTDEFINRSRLKHGDKYNYDKSVYVDHSTRVLITCISHGDFYQFPFLHMSGSDCPKCNSNISKKETEWLNSLNIPIEYRQYKIKMGDKTFKVDAYDPNNNTVYEFLGDFWHGNPSKYNTNKINPVTGDTFGQLYIETLYRENILKNLGYKIVSIWESDFKTTN